MATTAIAPRDIHPLFGRTAWCPDTDSPAYPETTVGVTHRGKTHYVNHPPTNKPMQLIAHLGDRFWKICKVRPELNYRVDDEDFPQGTNFALIA